MSSAAPVAEARVPGSVPFVELQALDLTVLPHCRGLWLPGRADEPEAARNAGLPPHGSLSPMGFWFYTDSSAATVSFATRTVTVTEGPPREGWGGAGARNTAPSPSSPGVRLKAGNGTEGEVWLTIRPEGAHVVASRAAWEAMTEPLLLVIGQWWRFHALEEALAELAEQARGDHVHASMPTFRTWRAARRLIAIDHGNRDLVQDLVHFAGSLWDPGPYCTSQRSAAAYRALADELGLEGWIDRLDERVEIVATTYETISDKLLHYRLSVWSIGLEVLILAVLAITLLR